MFTSQECRTDVVGKETDIGCLNKNGITMLDGENIEILDENM